MTEVRIDELPPLEWDDDEVTAYDDLADLPMDEMLEWDREITTVRETMRALLEEVLA